MKGRLQAVAIIGLVAVVLLIVFRQSQGDDSSESPTEQPTDTPSAFASTIGATASAAATATATGDEGGEETSVFDLEGGDCFSASGDQVEAVIVVECEETHIYEVFAVFDHEADADEAYPGDDAILEYADAGCQPLFEDYVAIDYQMSIYWITSVTPSRETWDEGGDREIVCALKLGEEGTETTGSAEGSGE